MINPNIKFSNLQDDYVYIDDENIKDFYLTPLLSKIRVRKHHDELVIHVKRDYKQHIYNIVIINESSKMFDVVCHGDKNIQVTVKPESLILINEHGVKLL